MPDQLPDLGAFLTITPEAEAAIELIGETKPQGSFRIKCVPNATKTEITFAWDDQYTEDDFEFPVSKTSKFNIVMDALSIAYVLADYTLDHKQGKFIMHQLKKKATTS